MRDRRLYQAGSIGQFVYVVKTGIVKHVVAADDGKGAVIRLVTAGGVSGLEAIAGMPYRHSALVLHPGSACRIPVAVIRKYEQLDPDAARELFRAWQQAVDDGERLLRMSHGSALLRVARFLQLVRDSVGEGEPVRVRRADIGAIFGLTEVSVARALSALRTRGLIGRRGNTLSHIDPRIAALVDGALRDRAEEAETGVSRCLKEKHQEPRPAAHLAGREATSIN